MYDAKHLVQAASGCQTDVDLICGKYIVDAKSMLGVFSLPTFDHVELGVAEDEEQRETGKFEIDSRIKTERGENHAIKKSGNEKTCTGA